VKRLYKTKTIDAQDMPFLKKSGRYRTGMDGVIFERNENGGAADAMRILEGYFIPMAWLSNFRSKRLMIQLHVYNEQRNGAQPEIMSQMISARCSR
jgi:hypothetical protein